MAESKLLQAVMQMPFVRSEDRFLVNPATHDGEEGVGQRYADDEQRSNEGNDRDLFKSEHGQRRQGETEEQLARVSHEYFRGMEVEEQETSDCTKQYCR